MFEKYEGHENILYEIATFSQYCFWRKSLNMLISCRKVLLRVPFLGNAIPSKNTKKASANKNAKNHFSPWNIFSEIFVKNVSLLTEIVTWLQFRTKCFQALYVSCQNSSQIEVQHISKAHVSTLPRWGQTFGMHWTCIANNWSPTLRWYCWCTAVALHFDLGW